MVSLGNIVCKSVGIAGMSAVFYDAFSVGKVNSKRASLTMDADHFEQIHSDTRSLTTESSVNNAIQQRIAKFRMNSPVPSIVGSISGGVKGFLNSLGDNIIPTSFAAMALAGKGIFGKIGAIGTAGYGVFMLLREGFGVTKKSPMN